MSTNTETDTGTSDLDAAAFERSTLFHRLDAYPWSEDPEFQGGLRAILGSVANEAQVEHLTLRAKCYYFARKVGTPVDFDGYKAWVESQRALGEGEGKVNGTVGPDVAGSLSGEGPLSGSGGVGDVSGPVVREAPKPASFAEICEMIAQGKPIPGIKDIPDTILEGQASESRVEKRRKPWENEGSGEQDAAAVSAAGAEGQLSWMK